MKTVFKYHLMDHHQKGFTLLEIMFSVSIIALLFLSLFRMQSSTITLASAIKFDSVAPVLAKRLLVKIEQDIDNFSESNGDFGVNYPGITWGCNIMTASFEGLDYISEEKKNRVKKIYIRISDRSGLRSYDITTWRFTDE
ncbi:MAG: prepilin-type N-terminal cleavage/methylation domain-containing protein [Deltaproteobacteria bacterium]|nr:prepilin-type N-terminal cleavage/methylation domain-containing protein [Deltaproteobacteria bacterium]